MRLCHGLAASSVPVSVKEVFNKETFFFTLLYFFEPTHNNTFIFQFILDLLARSVREFDGRFWKTETIKIQQIFTITSSYKTTGREICFLL